MNLTTTAPDGRTWTKNTDQPYEYVVALQIRGVWGDHTWALDIESAEVVANDLQARIDRMEDDGTDYGVAILAVQDADDEEGGIK